MQGVNFLSERFIFTLRKNNVLKETARRAESFSVRKFACSDSSDGVCHVAGSRLRYSFIIQFGSDRAVRNIRRIRLRIIFLQTERDVSDEEYVLELLLKNCFTISKLALFITHRFVFPCSRIYSSDAHDEARNLDSIRSNILNRRSADGAGDTHEVLYSA